MVKRELTPAQKAQLGKFLWRMRGIRMAVASWLHDQWTVITWPIVRLRRERDLFLQKVELYESEVASRCQHPWIDVMDAHEEGQSGVKYWKAWIKCRDCDEDWFLQARTPGVLSSDPTSQVFRSR